MKRLALLILDGEGIRTPGLIQELEHQGWAATWADQPEPAELAEGAMPDLGLFDPVRVTRQSVLALQALRVRNPRLRLVALGVPGEEPAWFNPDLLEPLSRMDRGLAPEAMAGALGGLFREAGQDSRKFTAEDLFGDILSDLEGPPATEAAPLPPAEPRPAAIAAPVAVLAPVPEAVVSHTRPGANLPVPEAAPAAEAEEEPVLEQFGNYNLLEKVAVGGMAELFKARQRGVHNFEKTVAIKRILPHLSDNDEFVRMFIDEAKLAAQLSHPNIVQIYDLGKASGFYYIAMEYVDGRDLRSLLRKVREYKLPMPEALAAAVIMKIASALDYAHRKRAIDDKELKLVHRDVSPQNILISYEGAVKLVDFGIAKAATKSTQTHSGALKGKLLYMSPEQALGEPLDGRSDIYSLGLVLAELLTGERCFQADSELGVLEKVRLGKVVDIRTVNPGISAEMGAILAKVLQKDLDQRYASARLLERDLKALLAKQGYEPSEHDLAEYVNTLLKGTREESESLLAARFPPRAEPVLAPIRETAPIPAGALEDPPTLSGLESGALVPAVPPVPPVPVPARTPARVPVRAKPARVRPWLLAAFGVVAVLAVWLLREIFLK
jgi:serine/threonine protein kinase